MRISKNKSGRSAPAMLVEGADSDASSSSCEEELRPLLASVPYTRVYHRRFYVLFLFCGLAFTQNCMWNLFGPIADPVKHVFHWTNGEISLLANWGAIAYVPMLPVVCILMTTRGIGTVFRMGATLLMISSVLRCISFEPITATWLMNAAQFFNGLAGPIAMAAPPVVSSIWFPPHQRTTATAIGAQSMNLGFAASFLIGPYIVPDEEAKKATTTAMPEPVPGDHHHMSLHESPAAGPIIHVDRDLPWVNISDNSSHIHRPDERRDRENIRKLMYIEAIFTAFFFILTMVYCPSKPAHPPSISAGCERLDYITGIKQIVRMNSFWLLALGYGISSGVINGWSSVLDIILQQIHISELQSGWIGFSMSTVSSVICVILGFLMDYIGHFKKQMLQAVCFLMAAFFLWLVLMLENILTPILPLIYLSIIVANTLCQCSVPIFYELCIESTFPVPEGISSGGLTLPNNLFTVIFLLMPIIPGVGSWWMTYVVVGAAFAAGVFATVFQEDNRRLAIDEQTCVSDSSATSENNVSVSVNTDSEDITHNENYEHFT